MKKLFHPFSHIAILVLLGIASATAYTLGFVTEFAILLVLGGILEISFWMRLFTRSNGAA